MAGDFGFMALKTRLKITGKLICSELNFYVSDLDDKLAKHGGTNESDYKY